MLGILVDTGKLFQIKPKPSLRENWEAPPNIDLLDTNELLETLQDECQAKSRASFLSKLFIELQPYGHCWLGCMVKKLERCTFNLDYVSLYWEHFQGQYLCV
jgi:hypothetical protein